MGVRNSLEMARKQHFSEVSIAGLARPERHGPATSDSDHSQTYSCGRLHERANPLAVNDGL